MGSSRRAHREGAGSGPCEEQSCWGKGGGIVENDVSHAIDVVVVGDETPAIQA